MEFTNFLLVIALILLPYYLLLIITDWIRIKSKAQLATAGSHQIHFSPQVVATEVSEDSISSRWDCKTNLNGQTQELTNQSQDSANGVLVDLGLETVSGESYEITPEAIAKFMSA